jgi:outer membrane protein assembly factor BamA
VRSQEVFAGAQLPFRHLRWSETLLAGFDAETDTVTCSGDCRVRDPKRELRSLRGGWLHDSRRAYGYGISPEEGFAVEAAAETSRTALGSDADAGATIFDVRGFRRVFRNHTVVAARAAAALAWGDVLSRRVFSAAGPGPSDPVFDFGRDTVGLLRGFAPEDVVGTRVAVANVDVRFPLARIQRGLGSWPIFFHTIHAAGFFDAGNAWDTTFLSADIRTSTGAELSLDAVIAHYVRLTFTGGAAWTRDPTTDTNRAALFGRIGYAF